MVSSTPTSEAGDPHRMSAERLVPLVPAALSFVVPFFGPLLALASIPLATASHARVWPGSSRRTVALAAIATVAGIWGLLLLLPGGAFLVVPLCGPENLLGWVVPTAFAVCAYGVLCVASVRRRSPWLWPLAGVAGAVAFSVGSIALDATDVSNVIC